MKFVILLCVLSVLLLQQAQASPVKLVERQERGLARQQATNEVAPAAVQAADEDDDDEDDDDDEPDLGDLIDDDDGKILLFSSKSLYPLVFTPRNCKVSGNIGKLNDNNLSH